MLKDILLFDPIQEKSLALLALSAELSMLTGKHKHYPPHAARHNNCFHAGLPKKGL